MMSKIWFVSNNSWGFDEQYDTVHDISSVVDYKTIMCNKRSCTSIFQSQDDGDGLYTVEKSSSVINRLLLI